MRMIPTLCATLAATLALSAPVHAGDAAPATHPLSPFFESLARAEAGEAGSKARILWWGDSAIVSDGYTGQVRARLAERFGDGGPGFILAAPAFDGYLRQGVRLVRSGWKTWNILKGNLDTGRYGLGGVQATSFGGASSTFETQGEGFDLVEVFYEASPKAGGLQVFVDDAGTATATESTASEQVTDRVWRQALAGAKKVRVRAAGEGPVRVYGVVLERKAPGVVLDTLGVLGLRARRLMNANAKHLEGQIAARKPNLLVVNFGGNERVDPGLTVKVHMGELRETVARLKRGAPQAACLVMGPIAHGVREGGAMKLDPALKKIYDAQRKAAAAEGCAFFDTVKAMGGGDQAIVHFRNKGWIAGDLAHLNGKGHRVVGNLVSAWLLTEYDAWKAARDATVAATPAPEPTADDPAMDPGDQPGDDVDPGQAADRGAEDAEPDPGASADAPAAAD